MFSKLFSNLLLCLILTFFQVSIAQASVASTNRDDLAAVSSKAPPSLLGAEIELLRDEDLMKALLSEDRQTMLDASLRLLERAGRSQTKLDAYFTEAFSQWNDAPEKLSEVLGVFDYFNIVSRAARLACERFMKTYDPQHPAWDAIARSYFHQKFLVNAEVLRSKNGALEEEDLRLARLYAMPVDLWLLRSIFEKPEKTSEPVMLAAIDALWWVYSIGRVEIHESLAILFENKNVSARVIEAAVEPLQYLYAGFSYPQVIPYLKKALQSQSVLEAQEEHRAKIEEIILGFIDHAEKKWDNEIRIFEEWFKREETLRTIETVSIDRRAPQPDLENSLENLSGRWILSKVSCVLADGKEMFIDPLDRLSPSPAKEFFDLSKNGDFKMIYEVAELSPPHHKTRLTKEGRLSLDGQAPGQFLFRILKESVQEPRLKREFSLSVLETIDRSFEARLEIQESGLAATLVNSLRAQTLNEFCFFLPDAKQKKYFERHDR
jgi:hypothetical protein